MLRGEGRVKGLDAERGRVVSEARRGHERDGAEAADVPIVKRASIAQTELDGGVRSLALGEVAVIDEQRAREAGLHDEAVSAGQVEHHELCATPAALDDRSDRATAELARRYFAQDVRLRDFDPSDARAA